MSLSSKHCIPCQGGTPALSIEEANRLLSQLDKDWQVNALGHLYKHFRFTDFMGAMKFANQVAIIAEQEDHHPDLAISWGKCDVEIWTHKINGLTESDFILAAKIDGI